MKVKIPKRFKFLSHPHEIEINDIECNSSGCQGIIRHLYKKIYLSSAMPISERDQVLLHEMFHMIERFFSVKVDDSDVDRLAEGWCYILKEIFGITFDWSEVDGSD